MKHRFFFGVLVCLGLSIPAASASAHLDLTNPPSRYGPNELKTAPCGRIDGMRSQNVTTFQGGETITIEFDEYIDHPGHFRVAFDDDGHDDFVEPECLAECDNRNMEIELYSNDTVLLDGIEDKNGGIYQVEVTLPQVECDNCTLQVVQVMTDKPPYEKGGNDLYYQCADLVLTAPPGGFDVGAGADMGSDAGGGADMGGGNNVATNNGANNGLPNNGDNNSSAGNNGSPDAGSSGGDGGQALDDISGEGGCCRTIPGRPAGHLFAFVLLLGLAILRERTRR